MAYREVTMLEVKEVLRLWLDGVPKARIAAQLRIDRKTVRRYVAAAVARGLVPGAGQAPLDDDALAAVLVSLRAPPERARGEAWARCEEQLRHGRAAAGTGGAALEGAPAPRAAGRRGPVRDAAPLRRRRTGLRPRRAERTHRRLRPPRGGPARHRLDDAPRAGSLRQAAPLPGMDLHRRPLAPPLRVAGPLRVHQDRHRGV